MDTNRLDVSPTATQASVSSARSNTPSTKLPIQGHAAAPPRDRIPSHNELSPRSCDFGIDLENAPAASAPMAAAGGGTVGVPLANLPQRSSHTRDDDDHDDDHDDDDAGPGEGDGGGDGGDDDDDEWNPSHPCFPHRNPHVLPSSAEYAATRIIRIPRDYMYSGDMSPAFSNIYPEILEPYVPEERFRDVVGHVNRELRHAHSPWELANVVDGLVGMLTLWAYEDAVDSAAKRRIAAVERYLKDVNAELAKKGSEARFVPLRRTGYLNVGPPHPPSRPRADRVPGVAAA